MFTLLVFSMGIVVSLSCKSHAILFLSQPLEALDRVETADKCSLVIFSFKDWSLGSFRCCCMDVSGIHLNADLSCSRF